MVQRQVGPQGRRTELEPDLLALADRCAEWGWRGRPWEDPDALAAEARAVLPGTDGGSAPS